MKKKVLFALICACVLGFAFSSCSSDDAEGGKVVDMIHSVDAGSERTCP